MARDDPSDGMAPAKEKEARSRKIPKGLHYPLREAKKQWQTGRTIISYYQSLAGNLLRIGRRWEAVEKMVADNESLARCKASAWRKNGMEGWFS